MDKIILEELNRVRYLMGLKTKLILEAGGSSLTGVLRKSILSLLPESPTIAKNGKNFLIKLKNNETVEISKKEFNDLKNVFSDVKKDKDDLGNSLAQSFDDIKPTTRKILGKLISSDEKLSKEIYDIEISNFVNLFKNKYPNKFSDKDSVLEWFYNERANTNKDYSEILSDMYTNNDKELIPQFAVELEIIPNQIRKDIALMKSRGKSFNLGDEIYGEQRWFNIIPSSDVVKRIQNDTKFYTDLKQQWTLTKEYLENCQILTKAYTQSNNNEEKEILLKKIVGMMQSVGINSKNSLDKMITWLEKTSTNPEISDREKKGIVELMDKIKSNKKVSVWFSASKELVPDTKIGLLWQSWLDSLDFFRTISSDTLHVVLRDAKKGDPPGWFFLRVVSTKTPEGKKRIDAILSEDGKSFLNGYTSGNLRGFPTLDNPAWAAIVQKHGLKSSYGMYMSTFLFKWMNVSIATSLVETLYQTLTWAFNRQNVSHCMRYFSKQAGSNKIFQTNENVEEMARDPKCNSPSMFLSTAMDFAIQNNEYNALVKPFAEFWENLCDNILRVDNIFALHGFGTILKMLINLGDLTKDTTYDEILKKVKEKKEQLEKTAEEYKEKLDSAATKTEEEIKKELEQLKINVTNEVDEYTNLIKNKSYEAAFKIWVRLPKDKGGPDIPSEWSETIDNGYIFIDKNGTKYEWSPSQNKFVKFN